MLFRSEQEEYLQNLLKKIQQEINQESKEKDSSIQSLVRFVLQIAISKNASDVHFEYDLDPNHSANASNHDCRAKNSY